MLHGRGALILHEKTEGKIGLRAVGVFHRMLHEGFRFAEEFEFLGIALKNRREMWTHDLISGSEIRPGLAFLSFP